MSPPCIIIIIFGAAPEYYYYFLGSRGEIIKINFGVFNLFLRSITIIQKKCLAKQSGVFHRLFSPCELAAGLSGTDRCGTGRVGKMNVCAVDGSFAASPSSISTAEQGVVLPN